MRTFIVALLVCPIIALSQYSARLSYSQGDPTYRWIQSSESVDLNVMYTTSQQWRVGATLSWQYMVLNPDDAQAIFTPLTLTARYYTSESGLRGYFEGQAGIVRRYYHSLIYSDSNPPSERDYIGWTSSIDYAPQYGLGFGASIPVVPDLALNLGLQIDVSPKGMPRSNIERYPIDGFGQTRVLIGLEYNL
jgi:hypothetical protein